MTIKSQLLELLSSDDPEVKAAIAKATLDAMAADPELHMQFFQGVAAWADSNPESAYKVAAGLLSVEQAHSRCRAAKMEEEFCPVEAAKATQLE